MPGSSFASMIIGQLAGAIGTDGSKFNNATMALGQAAIAAAITSYIIANTNVICTFAGVNPATGVPDPVVADTFKLVGACAPITATSFTDWVAGLESNIASGFQMAPAGMVGVVPTGVFKPILANGLLQASLQQSLLKAAHEANKAAPQQVVWEVICNAIIAWILLPATINPVCLAIPAVHGAFTGVLTVTTNAIV